MPTINYPEINLVAFFNDSVEVDCRASRVEQGKNGVIDRKRVHFINATKRTYSINATLRDRDTLQSFLEQNRGTPFVFRYDGVNNPGLFTVKNFTWDWLVYANNSGVWKLSLSLEEVFRPGWIPSIRIRSGAANVSGTDPKLSVQDIEGLLILPIGFTTSIGENITIISGSVTLLIPDGRAEGEGTDPTLLSNAIVTIDTGLAQGVGNDIIIAPATTLPTGVATGTGYDVILLPGQVSTSIPLGNASAEGYNPTIQLGIFVNISTGVSSSEGFDPILIPSSVTESIPLGEGSTEGFNPTLIPAASTVTILFGQSNVTGIDPIIIDDQLILIIPVGTSSGEGFNPTVIGELIDYSRITATGNGRVTADGSTRIISVARVTADGEDRITADGDQRIIL